MHGPTGLKIIIVIEWQEVVLAQFCDLCVYTIVVCSIAVGLLSCDPNQEILPEK